MTERPPGAGADADAVIALAVVTRPHGLRGEVRLHVHNPESTLLLDRARILLRPAGEAEARDVALEARQGPRGTLIARLGGVEGRTDAEAMRGAELCVRRSELPAPGPDEWYHVDLVGLEARDADGHPRGQVVGVVPYPSVDCLRVRSDDGVREVPMIEPWLVSVDLAGGGVVVDRLDELPLEPPRPGDE